MCVSGDYRLPATAAERVEGELRLSSLFAGAAEPGEGAAGRGRGATGREDHNTPVPWRRRLCVEQRLLWSSSSVRFPGQQQQRKRLGDCW